MHTQNFLLERNSTGISPVFVGPVLIERTYKDFLNKLKTLRPGLQDVISIGTDGEMVLVNALQSCFSKATEGSLLCFRHFRKKVEAMLQKMGIRGTKANQYVWEIFGKVSSVGSYETGLLESESASEFDAMVESIQSVFELIKQRSDIMKRHMIAKVRSEAGLPSISSTVDVPVKFYTLETESTNNKIKAKKQRKGSGFMETIEAIRSIDEEQILDWLLQDFTKTFDLERSLSNFSVLISWSFPAEKGRSTFPGFAAQVLKSYYPVICQHCCLKTPPEQLHHIWRGLIVQTTTTGQSTLKLLMMIQGSPVRE